MEHDKRLARAKAALDYWNAFQSGTFPQPFLHPSNLYSFDPIVDKPYIVPASFIPTYVGGNIEIRNTSGSKFKNEGSETTEFILGNFLPGGYKKRWNFLHFRTRWSNSEWKKQFADISLSFQVSKKYELNEIYPENFFSPFKCPTDESMIYFPDCVNVEEIPNFAKFFWDESNYFLDYQNNGGLKISRDPLSTPLWENVILSQEEPEEKFPFPVTTLIDSIGFIPDFRIVRCYYGNSIELFGEDKIMTRVIRFVNDKDKKHALIGTEHISQAVEFKISFKDVTEKISTIIKKNPIISADLRWNYLNLRIRESLLFEKKCAESTYDLNWIMNILYSIDYWMHNNEPSKNLRFFFNADSDYHIKVLNELIPEEKEIRLRLAGFENHSRNQILEWIQMHKSDILSVLEEINNPTLFKEYLNKVICETLKRILKVWIQQFFSIVGENMVFWQSSHINKDFLLIYAYDRYQGGSGIARELFILLKKMANDLSYNFPLELKRILQCDVDITDSIIHEIFLQYDSDYIWSVFREPSNAPEMIINSLIEKEEIKRGVEFKPKKREDLVAFILLEVRRLIYSKENSALYSELIHGYSDLVNTLGRTPRLVDIILYSSSNCFYDPRATIAFENYRTVKKGDLSEICARVSEMMPTCNNACPECIDAEESYGNQINSSMLLDRRLLIKLMEVIS